tara:strand:+ start:2415 stop:3443 length:1029 start_codon:yes stop_codon:yes gene_type:complete
MKFKTKYILLNIDSPVYIVVFCKLFNRKIVIRIDGLYSDRFLILNYKKLSRSKKLYYLLLKIFFNNNRAFFISNNLPEIFKLYFSDAIIFQSNFVRNQIYYHLSFCKSKSSKIILNAKNIDIPIKIKETKTNSELKILTLFDPVRARKRTDLMIVVLAGIKEYIDIPFQVNMHGFYRMKDYPTWFMNDAKDILSSSPRWLNLYSKYDNSNNSKVFNEFLKNDITFSLSLFDPCPNFIIESLCLGLPVIAPKSGGIPEIVGAGGLLVEESFSNKEGYFFDDLYRTENLSINQISKLVALYSEAIINLNTNLDKFKSRAKLQYKEELDMNRSLNSYQKYITSLT